MTTHPHHILGKHRIDDMMKLENHQVIENLNNIMSRSRKKLAILLKRKQDVGGDNVDRSSCVVVLCKFMEHVKVLYFFFIHSSKFK